ncbi:hypothetical protein BsWGS_13675 [Bradybaena similaris]
MKEECGNSNTGGTDVRMVESPSADLLSGARFLRGQSNGKEFRLAVSNKGKRSLVREGYMYRLDHSGRDKLSWRCSTRGCPAHLKTDPPAEMILQDNEKPHTHAVDALRFEKQLLRIACKRKAVEDCSTRPQDIISNEMTRLSDLGLSPKDTKFLQLAVYRERKKVFPQMPRAIRNAKTGQLTKFNGQSDSITSIPQPDIPNLPTDFYTQSPAAAYQPHFDMLADDGDYQHSEPPPLHQHHHHPHHKNDVSLQHLTQLQQHSELPPEVHQHPLLHHQLQPLESTLPQIIFHSNHRLPGSVAAASTSEGETTNTQQHNICAVQKRMCYSVVRQHEDLLNDRVQTLAFRRALQENRERLKGATVLQVAAGLGMLSHFAIQAGASKVYAIEPSGLAPFADRVVKENGLSSTITILQSPVEVADVPVKVDAIICEWMGGNLLCGSSLSSVLTARDQFLKQDGVMYPCAAYLHLAPFTDDHFQEKFKSWKQMKHIYGVSMESMVSAAKDALTVHTERVQLEGESVLANACQVCHFDMKHMALQDAELIKADFNFKCYSHNIMHGFASWFTVTFPGSVVLDTSPYALKTHWGQTAMYLKTPITVRQDSEIRGVFKMHPSPDSHKYWNIEIEFQVNRDKKYIQHWQCS